MELSKSKYCSGIQCMKMLWLDKNKVDEKIDISNQGVLDKGIEVGRVAKGLFGPYLDIPKNPNLSKMISDTKAAINNNDEMIVTEASFNYNGLFCSVDILIKKGDEFHIYEVKSSTEIKDIYLDDVSYQYYVLSKLGYNLTSVNIVYINREYERHGELDLKKLFIIKDLTNICQENFLKVENTISWMEDYLKMETEPDIDIDKHCFKPYDCPFFKYCMKELPELNVFSIRRMTTNQKLKLYKEGIYSFPDLLKEDLNSKFLQQIEFELYNKKDYIDELCIREFMNTLSYPIYFLDFETFQEAIPSYDGIKPYDQIPFQYSLHYIEKEGGELLHKEFLAEDSIDPRRSLAESLVRDIPRNVCTLAYNMGFEKGVIKKLAAIYPDLEVHLMNIHDNIKDLMIPFIKRYYYTKDMHGSYSIKYVLPALFPNDPSLDYHNLEGVHNGSEAMATFARLGEYDDEQKKIIRHNLLKYCELDTYAMVKIWQKLKDI